MQELPKGVRWALERLKREYSPYLEMKVSPSGKYQLYEYRRRKDNGEADHSKLIYLGIITDDGVLIPARHRNKEVVEERETAEDNTYADITGEDLAILTFLSMNARAPVKNIAKSVGSTTNATDYRIKKLEKRFGIRYLSEIDMLKIRFNSYVSFVKFKNKVPSIDEVRKALEEIPEVQLVLATSGDYHLVVFLYSMDNGLLSSLMYHITTVTDLKNYEAEWYTTINWQTYGVLPIRDKFFDLLMRVTWKRTKESPKPAPGELTQRECIVLRGVNLDGAVTFAAMDENNKWDKGTSRYTYLRLVDKGIIKRITIDMTVLPIKQHAVLIMRSIQGKAFIESRELLLSNIIKDDIYDIKKGYSSVSDIENPHGILLLTSVMKNTKLEDIKTEINSKIKGIELRELIVSEVIIGSICNRRFDNEYAIQYETLIKMRKVIMPERKEYNKEPA